MTVVTVERPEAGVEVRRTGTGWRPDDLILLVGSVLSAGFLMWIAFYELTPLRNKVALGFIWYVLFVVIYRIAVSQSEGKLAARDKMFSVIVGTGALIVLTPLVFIISYIVVKGFPGLNRDFFFKDLSTTGTLDLGGGAAHAIVGTI